MSRSATDLILVNFAKGSNYISEKDSMKFISKLCLYWEVEIWVIRVLNNLVSLFLVTKEVV